MTQAVEDLKYWKKYWNKSIQKNLAMLDSIQETTFEGIGKPEALRHELSGKW